MKYIRNFLFCLALASCSQAQTAIAPKVPSGYLYPASPGIPGKTVYICGERPFNANGDLVGGGDLTAQTRQIFENIKTALATVNMDLTNINQIKYSVKTGPDLVVVPVAQTQAVQAVEAAYLSTPPKITETKAVTQTTRDDVLIEIEVIAIK